MGRIRLSSDKIEEVVSYFESITAQELEVAESKDDFTDEIKQGIVLRNEIKRDNAIAQLKSMSPKRLFLLGLDEEADGWRQGYTKPTIEKRKSANRKKNKQAKQARRINRNK